MTKIDFLNVRIVAGKGCGVFTTRKWFSGQVVISAQVVSFTPVRTVYSFQTAPNTHCEFDAPARLLNHGCAPNLGIRDNQYRAFDFVAIRDITIGEELTWDYATSEYESIAVPICRCGAPICRRTIRGYRHLSPTERGQLRFTAGYLRQLG